MKYYFIMGILAVTLASCGNNKGTDSQTTSPGTTETNSGTTNSNGTSTGTNTTGMDSTGKSNGATTDNSSGVSNSGNSATGTTNSQRGSSDTTAVGTNKNMGKDKVRVDSLKHKKSTKQ